VAGHRARRHVDAERERLGRDEEPEVPVLEEDLDDLLQRREEAGVMVGDSLGDEPPEPD